MKVLETVSFTKGSGICQLKIKRENVLHVETVSFKKQVCQLKIERQRE